MGEETEVSMYYALVLPFILFNRYFIQQMGMEVGIMILSIHAQRKLLLQNVGGCRIHPQLLCALVRL